MRLSPTRNSFLNAMINRFKFQKTTYHNTPKRVTYQKRDLPEKLILVKEEY